VERTTQYARDVGLEARSPGKFTLTAAAMIRSSMRRQTYLYLISGLLFCWFSGAVLFKAHQEPIVYDDAYNAAVARNIAEGKGWVTDYHITIPFNSTVTTGPTLLLPAALLIKLFGAELWIPGTTVSLMMLTCLLTFGLALYRLLDNPERFLAATITSLIFLSLYEQRVWNELVGDGFIAVVVAAASVLICCVLDRRISNWKLVVLAGAFLALAPLAKLYGLISTLGALTALMWIQARGSSFQNSRCDIRLLGLLALGMTGVLLPWLSYKWLVWESAPEAIRVQRAAFDNSFFRNYGSGLTQLLSADNPPSFILENARRNVSGLAQSFEILRWWAEAWVSLLISVPMIVSLTLAPRRKLQGIAALLFILSCAALAHWLWYVCISPGDARYARIPIMLTCLIIALLLSIRLRVWLVSAALVLVVTLLPSAKKEAFLELLMFKTDNSAMLNSQKHFVQAALSGNASEPLVGCGWAVSRLLDYSATDDQPLKDLALMLRDAVRNETAGNIPGAGVIKLSKPLYARFAGHNGEWGYSKLLGVCPIPSFIDSVCTETLFSEQWYTIKRCSIDQVPAAVAAALSTFEPTHMSGMP